MSQEELERYAARHNLHEVLQGSVIRAVRERPANAVASIGRWLIEAGEATAVQQAELQKKAVEAEEIAARADWNELCLGYHREAQALEKAEGATSWDEDSKMVPARDKDGRLRKERVFVSMAGGGCEIARAELRGISLVQLRAIVAHLIRRCQLEGWVDYQGDLLVAEKVAPRICTTFLYSMFLNPFGHFHSKVLNILN